MKFNGGVTACPNGFERRKSSHNGRPGLGRSAALWPLQMHSRCTASKFSPIKRANAEALEPLIYKEKYPRQDSNLHLLPNQILSLARLPIPPLGL